MITAIDEIVDRESFEIWLKGRPLATIRLLASRIALRLYPVVLRAHNANPQKKWAQELTLSTSRACFISWAVAKYPAHDMKHAADAAYAAADAAADATADAADAAVYAADAAADASAYAVARAAYVADAADAAYAAYAAADASAYAAVIWQAIRADALVVVEEGAQALITMPLWLAKNSTAQSPRGATPSWVKECLQEFGQLKDDQQTHWRLWLNWYEPLLTQGDKSFFGETLDLKIALQEKKFWQGDAANVMARLVDLTGWRAPIEKEHDERQDEEPSLDLSQRPAMHQFVMKDDGKIHASPMQGAPFNAEMAEILRAGAVEKIKDLKERLTRAQVPESMQKALDGLIEALGNELGDIQDGYLLLHSRTMENMARSYDTEQARNEMAADALAQIYDVNETILDLKATKHSITQLEAERLAQRIDGEKVKEIAKHLQEVEDAAKESPLVDDSAIGALKLEDRWFVEPQKIIEHSSNGDEILHAQKVMADYISLKTLNVRNFVASALKILTLNGDEILYAQEVRADYISLKTLNPRDFVASALKVPMKESGKYLKEAAGKARSGSLKGIEAGVENLAKGAVIAVGTALVAKLAGTIAAFALLSASFAPLAKSAKDVKEKRQKEQDEEAQDNNTDDDDDSLDV